MNEDLAALGTESRHPDTRDLDRLPAARLVSRLHQVHRRAFDAVREALPDVARAVEAISASFEQGGRLFYVGAGTSGRLGVLDASECPPTFGVEAERVQAILAGGPGAVTHSSEDAEDDREGGAADLRAAGVRAGDVVVGIAASGRTPYVIGALEAARGLGATTVSIVNNPNTPLVALADIAIVADTGPEALTGSTRLKAGTAQKMILNLLSTAAMVGTGRAYENLMVDVRATNEKLRARATRIVSEAARVPPERAVGMLEACDWECKPAIVALAAGVTPDEARRRLDAAGGFVRAALGE